VKHSIAQAQEIIDVLERHGVAFLEVTAQGIRLLCRRCQHVWEIPDFQALPGLIEADQAVGPGRGKLPFTGWQCPHGCSLRDPPHG
jgi:hypothetical protein